MVRAPFGLGPFNAYVPTGFLTTQIVDRDQCVAGPRVVSIEPLGVDPDVIHDSPVRVLARVEYDARVCCGEPLPIAVEAGGGDPAVHHYELLDCAPSDCDCVPGAPTRHTAIVYLGLLPPGPQRVFISGTETAFDVPSG
jgi:hypothetical protein